MYVEGPPPLYISSTIKRVQDIQIALVGGGG